MRTPQLTTTMGFVMLFAQVLHEDFSRIAVVINCSTLVCSCRSRAVSTSENWDVNVHTARWSGSVNWCLAEGWGNGGQRRPMGLMAQEWLYLF